MQRRRRYMTECPGSAVAVSLLFLSFVISIQKAESKNIFDFLGLRHQVKVTESVTGGAATSDLKKTSKKPREAVRCQILIKAPVDVVWQTVHYERDSAPDLVSNRLLEGSGNHSIYEQKWTVVPLISRTTCVIDEVEYPNTRIDYKLLKSDEFKVMEGSWLFTPSEDGSETTLEITAQFEPRRPDPVVFLNAVARRKMAKRLAHIKKLAEESRAELRVKATVL